MQRFALSENEIVIRLGIHGDDKERLLNFFHHVGFVPSEYRIKVNKSLMYKEELVNVLKDYMEKDGDLKDGERLSRWMKRQKLDPNAQVFIPNTIPSSWEYGYRSRWNVDAANFTPSSLGNQQQDNSEIVPRESVQIGKMVDGGRKNKQNSRRKDQKKKRIQEKDQSSEGIGKKLSKKSRANSTNQSQQLSYSQVLQSAPREIRVKRAPVQVNSKGLEHQNSTTQSLIEKVLSKQTPRQFHNTLALTNMKKKPDGKLKQLRLGPKQKKLSKLKAKIIEEKKINQVESVPVREYVIENLSPDEKEERVMLAKTLLQELHRLQSRIAKKNRFTKRYLVGLKECSKSLKQGRAKMIFLARNIDKIQCEGGLDEKVNDILRKCQVNNIPVLFTLSRRELGKSLGNTSRFSSVSIINPDGAYEIFKKLSSAVLNHKLIRKMNIQEQEFKFLCLVASLGKNVTAFMLSPSSLEVQGVWDNGESFLEWTSSFPNYAIVSLSAYHMFFRSNQISKYFNILSVYRKNTKQDVQNMKSLLEKLELGGHKDEIQNVLNATEFMLQDGMLFKSEYLTNVSIPNKE